MTVEQRHRLCAAPRCKNVISLLRENSAGDIEDQVLVLNDKHRFPGAMLTQCDQSRAATSTASPVLRTLGTSRVLRPAIG
jgi:hypothetical protein